MLFSPINALPVLALCALGSARALKRDTTKVSLYAYGGQTNGAPVFYDNGLAYIGFGAADSTDTTATNITFTVDSNDNTTPWYITANSTSSSTNSTVISGSPMFYINPSEGAFEQAGFVTNSSDLPTGASTAGFSFFGTSVAYAKSDSDYELMFSAVDTNTTGVWALYWNSDGSVHDGATPITLKTTAPPSVLTSTTETS
ncbi:hypothetical protein PVAG01_03529 [Phlyctema vagabunda]|uniref:Uncharacterized protein n=1 Tax=Phlyctema vagabunda TaxID=108571 RepID=A0ABR4PLN5_9HELO